MIRMRGTVLAVAFALVSVVLMAGCSQDRPVGSKEGRPAAAEPPSAGRTVHLDADYAVYPSPDDLKTDADLVLIAKVSSVVTELQQDGGVDGAGDPVPTLPHLLMTLEPGSVIKGTATVPLRVQVTGGEAEGSTYVLDGVPALEVGDEAMFFLAGPVAGVYAPLSGGTAMAPKAADGTYVLPSEARGGSGPLALNSAGAADDGASTGSSSTVCEAARDAAVLTQKAADDAQAHLASARQAVVAAKKVNKKAKRSLKKAKQSGARAKVKRAQARRKSAKIRLVASERASDQAEAASAKAAADASLASRGADQACA